ncbi:flavin reductase [Nocardia tengchongensis]
MISLLRRSGWSSRLVGDLCVAASTAPAGLSADRIAHVGSDQLEQRICVQMLAQHQEQLARNFASSGDLGRIARHKHRHIAGVPVLSELLAWSVCLAVDINRYGDHELVVGTVVAAESG